jgi:hyperosmotically inducible periplasmic protein
MKKFLFMAVAAFTLITLSQSCKKKVSDADVAKAANEALVTAGMTGTTVTVEKGVATLTGVCKDDKCKTDCEAAVKAVKGVTSVVNSCTVTPPAQSLTTSSLDAAVQQKVKDGLKDLVGLTLQGFSGKGAIINGTINAAGKTKLMQMLASAKVLLDKASNITIK